ncbi:L-type lectin-domain containing receptor kinase IX.1-like [Phalaenopsis equestris]|uniref:L-type lectin-domain containing receptor kinase IX.1-like n=1 Tax=Phalaenopsis equestris TaxID=78828 RepID=UPI0009E5E17E|nr:L-type lectin-domain containing receptor kinase IX.1-like [Phalaenopsis equestris]
MASSSSSSSSCLLFIFVYLVLPTATSLSFSFPSFNSSTEQFIAFQNDTFLNGAIILTKNEYNSEITGSVGRAYYRTPIPLHDSTTCKSADFTTHFSFTINAFNQSYSADGLAFFLSPFPSVVPPDSAGGSMGLVERNNTLNESANRILAVEFDTYKNDWDPNANHVGININSMKSAATVTWNSNIKDGRKANAWISYNATTMNLSVLLTYDNKPNLEGKSSLYHIVNLSKILPEEVAIGFSAATGSSAETHSILSWEFSSTPMNVGKKKRVGLIVGISVSTGLLLVAASFLWYFLRRKKKAGDLKEEEDDAEDIDEGEFEKGRGPKKFPFGQLAAATRNFADELKLGQGGFGGVYRGLLADSKLEVAIKRVSKGSQQGKKEYISEIKVISRLRHRNLVQLVGWCHERKELLLVYEFMPNGSLDSHLYSRDRTRYLSWHLRFKIAVGLASALLYLHEEWEECVVHRDVKPSNVMLDGHFNAKLGDFGLARLVDHERGSQTTMLAGTMGYLAPEIVTTGKASKETDVYSFGVVALELACGRRPVEHDRTEEQAWLVSWVWELYGRGVMLDCANERLNSEFDEGEMSRLMIVGLWCSHPDSALRPSIRQAMAALKLEAPLPELPGKMPVPTYYAPPLEMCRFTYTSSSGGMSSDYNTNSSDAASSAAADSSPTAARSEVQITTFGSTFMLRIKDKASFILPEFANRSTIQP